MSTTVDNERIFLALLSYCLLFASTITAYAVQGSAIPDGEDSEDAIIEEASFEATIKIGGAKAAVHSFTLEFKLNGSNWSVYRTVNTSVKSYNGYSATVALLSRSYNNTTKCLDYSARFTLTAPGGGTQTYDVSDSYYMGW